MDQDLIRALQVRGIDVTTAQDEGMIERADEDHLDYATERNRVLFSFNRGDFYRLHTEYLLQSKPHSGIILSKQQQYSVGELMRRILRIVAIKPADEMKNWVEFLNVWGQSRNY